MITLFTNQSLSPRQQQQHRWPALMPLIQFLHWNLHKNKDLIHYQDRVLPGTQPFELNWKDE